MSELDIINDDIEKRRKEQEKFKKSIAVNIAKTYRYYEKTEREHMFFYNVKIGNYKIRLERTTFKLYIGRKYILGWKHTFVNKYYTGIQEVFILHFDNSSILEMQDFNDKFVEVVKERLLNIKEKEEDSAIEMIALKSLV